MDALRAYSFAAPIELLDARQIDVIGVIETSYRLLGPSLPTHGPNNFLISIISNENMQLVHNSKYGKKFKVLGHDPNSWSQI